jgi:hypothetical protein
MAHVRRLIAWMILGCLSSMPVYAQSSSTSTSEKAEALAEAARKGDATAVSKLLDDGVDVNTKFRYGVTALSYACDHGQLDVVKVLLARGADVNVKDTFYGATPLTWASSPATKRKPEHAEIVGLLLKHGASGVEDALLAAVSEGDLPMTRIILDSGALTPANLSDALEAATASKHVDIVTLLERSGAKPHPELKMDDAQLSRYAGTYRSTAGAELVITSGDGRLTLRRGRADTQPLTLAARTETTFAAPQAPGITITFRIESGKVTTLVVGTGTGGTTYTKIGGE